MFFNDGKKDEHVEKPKPQGILEILTTGIMEVILFTFKSIVTAGMWLGRKIFGQFFRTLGHLLDFHGIDREVATRRIAMAGCLLILFLGIPLFVFYRSTTSTVSATTVNISMPGKRIFFPDSSYFAPTETVTAFDFRPSGVSELYLSYRTDAEEESIYPVPSNSCQLIPKGVSAIVASKKFPRGAEGFEKEVSYYIETTVGKLSGFEYILEFLLNPRYVFKNKDEVAATVTRVSHTGSWGKLRKEWDTVDTFSSGNKYFIVKALANHHAIICS